MEGGYFYHICLRGNNHQDIFYTNNDLVQIVNRLAIAADETETDIVAFCFLHNHFHLVVRTKNKSSFMHYFRMSLTAYFNREHSCIGNVGTRKHFAKCLLSPSLDNGDELKNTISYVLRNPLWHGLTKSFMQYRWSSLCIYFNEADIFPIIDNNAVSLFLPYGKKLPEKYMMEDSGLISFHSFVNKEIVEFLFGNYNNFIGYINSPTSIELNAVERKGKRLKSSNDKDTSFIKIPDITISEQIIKIARIEYSKTIPNLSSIEKIEIVLKIKQILPQAKLRQLARILFIPESTLRYRITRLPNL